jgi:hypothetical protein
MQTHQFAAFDSITLFAKEGRQNAAEWICFQKKKKKERALLLLIS